MTCLVCNNKAKYANENNLEEIFCSSACSNKYTSIGSPWPAEKEPLTESEKKILAKVYWGFRQANDYDDTTGKLIVHTDYDKGLEVFEFARWTLWETTKVAQNAYDLARKLEKKVAQLEVTIKTQDNVLRSLLGSKIPEEYK